MPYGEMTVGDLRRAIEGMPDDATLMVKPHSPDDFASCEPQRRRDHVTGEVVRTPGHPARVWSYNTRVVHNMYQAHDDRFTQPRILLIEIGEDGP